MVADGDGTVNVRDCFGGLVDGIGIADCSYRAPSARDGLVAAGSGFGPDCGLGGGVAAPAVAYPLSTYSALTYPV